MDWTNLRLSRLLPVTLRISHSAVKDVACGCTTSTSAISEAPSGRSQWSSNHAGVKIAGLKLPTRTMLVPLISGLMRIFQPCFATAPRGFAAPSLSWDTARARTALPRLARLGRGPAAPPSGRSFSPILSVWTPVLAICPLPRPANPLSTKRCVDPGHDRLIG